MDSEVIGTDANELRRFRVQEEERKQKVRSKVIGASVLVVLLIAVAYSLNTACASKVKLGAAEVKVAKQNMTVLSTASEKSKSLNNKTKAKLVASTVDEINPRLDATLNEINPILASSAVNQYWNIPGRIYVYVELNKYDTALGDVNKDSITAIDKLANAITKK